MLNCFRGKSKKKDKSKSLDEDNVPVSPVDGGAPSNDVIPSQGPIESNTSDIPPKSDPEAVTAAEPLTNGTSTPPASTPPASPKVCER